MHRVEQSLEGVLPGPTVGQVEGEPAGRTGGHVDQTVTDGRAGRTGVEGAGQGPAGAGEGEGERGRREPGGVRLEVTLGGVRERAVLQLGDDLFPHGVPPVITCGVRQRQRGVGECGAVAPGGGHRTLSQAALSQPNERHRGVEGVLAEIDTARCHDLPILEPGTRPAQSRVRRRTVRAICRLRAWRAAQRVS